ncbi:uncharacterized protein LOC116348555 [Contarinia nasturtii]|uniref:uncharacterized protein LOC116348555 n=1 Tax=Contarinia nasturtii TaxID=265458 RepID=UPI0012D47D42|nr:uncharacterized protein LOC116348555 [Contarinia nasturtii]
MTEGEEIVDNPTETNNQAESDSSSTFQPDSMPPSIFEPKSMSPTPFQSDSMSPSTFEPKSVSPAPFQPNPVLPRHCFTCHKEKAQVSCTTCMRSYCSMSVCLQNVRLSDLDKTTWRCKSCVDIDIGAKEMRKKKIHSEQLKSVLNYIYNVLTTIDKNMSAPFMKIQYGKDGNDGTNNGVVYKMDLMTIREKIENGAYSCCEEFQSDLKWIVHNTIVQHSDDQKNDQKGKARALFNYAKEEVYSYKMCHDCYINYDEMEEDWFANTCKKPHLLIWAKQRTFPYWPAKLMRYHADSKNVDVRYFGGDHLRAILPAKDCLLYSRDNPSANNNRHKDKLMEATKEAEHYIENLIKNYRLFNYAEPATFLRGDMLERHLYDTIPNAWKELGKSDVPPPIPAPATVARRMSTPVQRSNRQSVMQTPEELLKTGRCMTRRLSTIMESRPDTPETKKRKVIDTTQKTSAYRRQSLQCERPSARMSATSAMYKAKDSMGVKMGQKRKMNQNAEQPHKIQKISHAPNQLQAITLPSAQKFNFNPNQMFKVPFAPNQNRNTVPNGMHHQLGSIKVKSEFCPSKLAERVEKFSPSKLAHNLPNFNSSKSVQNFSSQVPMQRLPGFTPQPAMQNLSDYSTQKSLQNLHDFSPQPAMQKLPDFTPQQSMPSLPDFNPPISMQPLPDFTPQPMQKLPNISSQVTVRRLSNYSPQKSMQNLPDSAPQASMQKLPNFSSQKSMQNLPDIKPQISMQKAPVFTPHSAQKLPNFAQPKSPQKPSNVKPPKSTPKGNFNDTWNLHLSQDMSAACRSVVDSNMRKLTESVRQSLNQTLVDFMVTSKPDAQIKKLQSQLDTQRSYYCEKLVDLRNQNNTLKTNAKKFKDKIIAAKKAEDAIKESEQKVADMTRELKKFKEKYNAARKAEEALKARDQQLAELAPELEKYKKQYMEAKKAEEALKESNQKLTELNEGLEKAKMEFVDQLNTLKTENTERQVTDSDENNRYETLEIKYHQLIDMNKELSETNVAMSTAMENLQSENGIMADKIVELESASELITDKAYQQCATMITETKQKKWCITCGMPDGPYYCSEKCEEYRTE